MTKWEPVSGATFVSSDVSLWWVFRTIIQHRDTAQLMPQPKPVLKELCNEPAEQPDRLIAPVESSEPGERITKKLRAPKGRQMMRCEKPGSGSV